MATDWCLDNEVQTAILLFSADGRVVDVAQCQIYIHFGNYGSIEYDSKDKILGAAESLYGPRKNWAQQIICLKKSSPTAARLSSNESKTWYLRDVCSILLVYMYYLSYDRTWCGPQNASDLRSWLKIDCSWHIFNEARDTLVEKELINQYYGDDGSDGITAPRPDTFKISRDAVLYLDRRFEQGLISPSEIGLEIDRRNHRPQGFYRTLCIGIFA